MSESKTPKAGGLWARLFGVENDTDETPAAPEAKAEPAIPVAEAAPVAPPSNGEAVEEAVAVAEIVAEPAPPVIETPYVEEPPVLDTPAAPQVCSACGAPRQSGAEFCHDCGWMFPVGGAAAPMSADPASSTRESDMAATTRLQNRYELGDLLCERAGVQRHRGIDHQTGQGVVIVSAPLAAMVAPV